jgi:hypothetical protein
VVTGPVPDPWQQWGAAGDQFFDLVANYLRAGTTTARLAALNQVNDTIRQQPGAVAAAFKVKHDSFFDDTLWTRLFRRAGYTENFTTAPLPDQPVPVFRGCTHPRRFGMAWTTNIDAARALADLDGGWHPQNGNVYATWLWPDAMLARIQPRVQDLNEYVVDPDYFRCENIVPIVVDMRNDFWMGTRYGLAGRPTDWTVKRWNLEPVFSFLDKYPAHASQAQRECIQFALDERRQYFPAWP